MAEKSSERLQDEIEKLSLQQEESNTLWSVYLWEMTFLLLLMLKKNPGRHSLDVNEKQLNTW
jgi:hypothetical protein